MFPFAAEDRSSGRCQQFFRDIPLVGGLVAMNFIFPYIGNFIIPSDFHIFQRGGPTTNQSTSFEVTLKFAGSMKLMLSSNGDIYRVVASIGSSTGFCFRTWGDPLIEMDGFMENPSVRWMIVWSTISFTSQNE